MRTAKIKGDALNQEIAREKELQGRLKAAQVKEKAQSQIQNAAKAAIRKAVKNAAILALAEKKKANEAEANERSGKDIGSANTLAAQAQTAAEERMAKKDIARAREDMKRVREEKKRALAEVQAAAASQAKAKPKAA